jgi:hypothetical protein
MKRIRIMGLCLVAMFAMSTVAAATAQASGNSIDGIVGTAKGIYYGEAQGPKVLAQLGRIARDDIMLNALSKGDLAGAHAEAEAQMAAPINHTAHVTRISVIRGSRVLFNAIVNSDGVFVVAPQMRDIRFHGRLLGTLLVSIQDVVGYVKLVHNLTGSEVLVRGGSGRVRTSLGAARGVPLPTSGHVTIAGRRYLVRSFPEVGWANEPLTVWILARA